MRKFITDPELAELPPVMATVGAWHDAGTLRKLIKWIGKQPENEREWARMNAADTAGWLKCYFTPLPSDSAARIAVDENDAFALEYEVEYEDGNTCLYLAREWQLAVLHERIRPLLGMAGHVLDRLREYIPHSFKDDRNRDLPVVDLRRQRLGERGMAVYGRVRGPHTQGFFGRFHTIHAYLRKDASFFTFEEYVFEEKQIDPADFPAINLP